MNIENQKYWDSEAYDWVNHGAFGNALSIVVDLVRVNVLEVQGTLNSESKVLDIGAGADNSIYFSMNSKDIILQKQIYSLDYSKNMLSYQQSKYKIQADAGSNLPFKSDSLDLCTSFFLMRYLSDTSQVGLLKEIKRVLKSNAWFLIIDLLKNDYSQQLATFDPVNLAEASKEIGFFSVLGKLENLRSYKKYSEGYNSGGYGYNYVDFKCGVLLGRK